MTMQIKVQGVSKSYGAFHAVDDVTLDIQSGELLALLGPSGSGKTTLLRIIAGLEAPDRGRVVYGDEVMTHRAVRERNVGFVFQHYALFGHLSVFENIAFGLRVRKVKESEIRDRVQRLLHLIRLEHLAKRLPSQLSGGQRQRVALARALAPEPRMLLLDEPFAALDTKVRQELRDWIRRLHDELRVTSIFVTHDQAEAFEIADRVVVTHQGRVEQVGTPEQIFESPANAFVLDFLGRVNVLHGQAEGGKVRLGRLEVPYPEYAQRTALPATGYVRHFELDVERAPNLPGGVEARIQRITRVGFSSRVELLVSGDEKVLHAELDPGRFAALNLNVGDTVFIAPRKTHVFLKQPLQAEATGTH